MLVSRNVFLRIGKRYASTKVDDRAHSKRTSVIFLHGGQPRTEYYAKDFLLNSTLDYLGLPYLRSVTPAALVVNKKVRACLEEYGKRPTVNETLEIFAGKVEGAISELLPEFGRIRCSSHFLYDGQSFCDGMEDVICSGTDHIVLIPVAPHFSCSQSGLLLNAAVRFIYETTVPLLKNGRPDEKVRIRPQTGHSFEVSTVHRWGSHPTVSDYWCHRLASLSPEVDGIVFCAPAARGPGRTEHSRAVWASCERVAENLPSGLPWSLAFYNGWDQLPLPLLDSLSKQVKVIVGKPPSQRNIAVVPITEVFPTFNTFSVLPSILSKVKSATLLEPEYSSGIITQGMAELLKNHLLGRRNPKLSQYCDTCTRKDCRYNRLILS